MLNELISEDIYWFYLILVAPTPPNVWEIIRFRLISAYSISWFQTIHKFIHIFFIHFARRFSFFSVLLPLLLAYRSEKEWRVVERKATKHTTTAKSSKPKKKRARLSDGFFLILAPNIQNFFIRSASKYSVKWFTRTLWMSGFDIRPEIKMRDGIAIYKINYNAMR